MRLALLFVAAVIAIITGVAVMQFSGDKAPPPRVEGATDDLTNVSTVDVLVAKTAIPAGATIEETMVDKQPWPSHLVAESFITSKSKDANVIGKVARVPFLAREPLLSSKIGNPGDPSFMAANLPAGARAASIAVDGISGVAGYVFPGDRVDVLFTYAVPDAGIYQNVTMKSPRRLTERPTVTEVLFYNVPVLAVNSRIVGAKDVPTSVTLELPQDGPQRVRLAEKMGTLSVALRSVKDKDSTARLNPATAKYVSRVFLTEGQSGAGDVVRVIRGLGKNVDEQLPQTLLFSDEDLGTVVPPETINAPSEIINDNPQP
jgi:pilus assembly protein CpaB